MVAHYYKIPTNHLHIGKESKDMNLPIEENWKNIYKEIHSKNWQNSLPWPKYLATPPNRTYNPNIKIFDDMLR